MKLEEDRRRRAQKRKKYGQKMKNISSPVWLQKSTVVFMRIFHIMRSQKNPGKKCLFLKNSGDWFLYKSTTYADKRRFLHPRPEMPIPL